MKDNKVKGLLLDILRLIGQWSREFDTNLLMEYCQAVAEWKKLVSHRLRYKLDIEAVLLIEFETNARKDEQTPQYYTVILMAVRDSSVKGGIKVSVMADYASVGPMWLTGESVGRLLDKMNEICMELEGVTFSTILTKR